MSYLPFKSLAHKFFVRMPLCKLPESLSTVGWNKDSRVRIIADQSMDCFENTTTVLHSRQHWMPHNGQVATTIQTRIYLRERITLMESITICSTHMSGLYKSNYQLYEGGCVDKGQLKISVQQNIPRTLEWIRNRLLEDENVGTWEGVERRRMIILRPLVSSGFYFFV
jgi:hypothetical protein